MRKVLILLFVLAFVLKMPGFTGCANIIPPTGGPKDSLPPLLLKSLPANRTRQFTGKKIVISFNEYIELKELRKNLIVSPVPKLDPSVESKLKTLTITIRDTLRPNTTYSLNFGRAIVDINEGNALKDFTYLFSTGTYIDSMEYSGRVLMAVTGRPDSTLTVLLHDQLDDSAVFKKKPRYIARLDSSGNFHFHHLQPGTYALYALKDEGGQYEYTSNSMIFAFADSPVTIGAINTSPTLWAFEDTSGSKPIKKPVSSSTGQNKLLAPKKSGEKEKPHLLVGANLSAGLLDLLTPFQLTSQVPLRSWDSTRIRMTTDSFQTDLPARFELDSTGKKLTLLSPKLTPNSRYKLVLQKDFAEDTLGNHLLKIDTLTITTKKESDYGTLRLRFRNVDFSRNPVLQFVQNDKIVMSWPFSGSRIYQNKLFLPGDYELRILFDANGNGKWDAGKFFGHHLQPETVEPIRRKLTVRVNWDNQLDINL